MHGSHIDKKVGQSFLCSTDTNKKRENNDNRIISLLHNTQSPRQTQLKLVGTEKPCHRNI